MIFTKKQLEDILKIEIKAEDFAVDSVVIDSEVAKKGSLFVAINTGYNYSNNAEEKGAVAVILEEENAKDVKLKTAIKITVKDSKKALIELAKAARKNFKGQVIVITGSVGKTSTKEILYQALKDNNKKVYKTKGNYNNEIGLPLTLANLSNDFDFAIIEMGTSSKGEIAFLSNLTMPNVAVVTEVASAHGKFFKSLDEIAKEKLSIVSGLNKTGTFIYSGEYFSENLKEELENIKTKFKNVLINNSDFKLVESTMYFDKANIIFKDKTQEKQVPITAIEIKTLDKKERVETVGYSPNLDKILLTVFMILKALKINLAPVDVSHVLRVKKIENIEKLDIDATYIIMAVIPEGRGDISFHNFGNKIVLLMDSSYNANPLSMMTSLAFLSKIPHKNLVLVLGEMLELNEKDEIEEHLKLTEVIKSLTPKSVLLIGKNMAEVAKFLIKMGVPTSYFRDTEKMVSVLKEVTNENDFIFIKGSLGSGVNKIAKLIKGKK